MPYGAPNARSIAIWHLQEREQAGMSAIGQQIHATALMPIEGDS
jgi:hypothetical protein